MNCNLLIPDDALALPKTQGIKLKVPPSQDGKYESLQVQSRELRISSKINNLKLIVKSKPESGVQTHLLSRRRNLKNSSLNIIKNDRSLKQATPIGEQNPVMGNAGRVKAKKKHPLVRSFIIKDIEEESMKTFKQDYQSISHQFSNMLSNCLCNKSLAGKESAPSNSGIFSSFNNIKLKESLKPRTSKKSNRSGSRADNRQGHVANTSVDSSLVFNFNYLKQEEIFMGNYKSQITPNQAWHLFDAGIQRRLMRKDSKNSIVGKNMLTGARKIKENRKFSKLRGAKQTTKTTTQQPREHFLNVRLMNLASKDSTPKNCNKMASQKLFNSFSGHPSIFRQRSICSIETDYNLLTGNSQMNSPLIRKRKISMRTPSPEKLMTQENQTTKTISGYNQNSGINQQSQQQHTIFLKRIIT